MTLKIGSWRTGGRANSLARLILLLGLASGCAGGPQAPGPAGGRVAAPASLSTANPQQQKALIPAGYGTFKQDEFTVALRSGALQVKVTPLAETVIRTAAPDTYDRLHRLAQSRNAEALRAAGATSTIELFLVSFFSYEPNATFQPENLQVTHQGRQMRAVTIMPLTPGWGRLQLQQQEQQSAIYVFTSPIDYELPMSVRYGLEQSEDWGRILANLQTERTKILSRAKN